MFHIIFNVRLMMRTLMLKKEWRKSSWKEKYDKIVMQFLNIRPLIYRLKSVVRKYSGWNCIVRNLMTSQKWSRGTQGLFDMHCQQVSCKLPHITDISEMAIVVWKEKQFCFGCCKNELNQIWTREEREMGPFPPFDVFSVGVVSDGHKHKKLF